MLAGALPQEPNRGSIEEREEETEEESAHSLRDPLAAELLAPDGPDLEISADQGTTGSCSRGTVAAAQLQCGGSECGSTATETRVRCDGGDGCCSSCSTAFHVDGDGAANTCTGGSETSQPAGGACERPTTAADVAPAVLPSPSDSTAKIGRGNAHEAALPLARERLEDAPRPNAGHLLPRGALATSRSVAHVSAARASSLAPEMDPPHYSGSEGASGGADAALLARAGRAEARASALDTEVRKLRAELQADRNARIEVSGGAALATTGPRGTCARCADATVRAEQAEAEVLRLHCELQAFRDMMFLTERSASATKVSALPPYEAAACLRYSCGCLRDLLHRCGGTIANALCCPMRCSNAGIGGLVGRPTQAPLKAVYAGQP